MNFVFWGGGGDRVGGGGGGGKSFKVWPFQFGVLWQPAQLNKRHARCFVWPVRSVLHDM